MSSAAECRCRELSRRGAVAVAPAAGGSGKFTVPPLRRTMIYENYTLSALLQKGSDLSRVSLDPGRGRGAAAE